MDRRHVGVIGHNSVHRANHTERESNIGPDNLHVNTNIRDGISHKLTQSAQTAQAARQQPGLSACVRLF
jgi:hypothetical protein